MNGFPVLAPARNEPVLAYTPGSGERKTLAAALRDLASRVEEIPLRIDGQDVRTDAQACAVMPHAHRHIIARAHLASRDEVFSAIGAAKRAREDWAATAWQDRAAVFLRAADLLSGPWRARLNAATMLGQSKTVHQAEIDSACELADFWRFNVQFMRQLYEEQPQSSPGSWSQVDYRPLEGFVLAIAPFNFTAIAGNLPSAPALLGNTVVWKPAATAMLSAHLVLKLLEAAGLPPGVINMVNGDGEAIAALALADEHFAGLHFTGSTTVFNSLWRTAGANVNRYRAYPRLVGETGGKNFILAHPSADIDALATAIVRGGYEYQGQKCSAASRIYVPSSMWVRLKDRIVADVRGIRMGDVADMSTFMGAVIDERAWQRLKNAADEAARSSAHEVLAGGFAKCDQGWFVEPTLVQTSDLGSRLLKDELFGPIVTVFVFDDGRFDEIVRHLDRESAYALTGAVFCTDRLEIARLTAALRDGAGNFYINDKPTGAVVGQQPFGGARRSGTNDKAGSLWNLMRWVSPRTIKETFDPALDYRYASMA